MNHHLHGIPIPGTLKLTVDIFAPEKWMGLEDDPASKIWVGVVKGLFSGANLLLVLGRLIMLISPFESMYTYFLLNMGFFQCHVGEFRGKNLHGLQSFCDDLRLT